MLLTREQVKQLLLTRNVAANEVCDTCSMILGPVRFTSANQKGVWCSRKCRDGENAWEPGRCRGCQVSLIGKRRGSLWCSDTCKARTCQTKTKTPTLYPPLSASPELASLSQ